MPDNQKPKVIILESDTNILEHAGSILTDHGWDVTCETVSKEALYTLSQSGKSLFALFISSFKLPKMKGDEVLKKVKTISPITQRMLLVPYDHPEILISAINTAKIHASIISPFNDEALIEQAQHRLKHFKHELKRQRLKRVINHQNRQMLRIAQSLKKTDEKHKRIISEKKARKLKLESKKKNISVSEYIKKQKTKLTPDAFHKEFTLISNSIKNGFDQITKPHGIDPLCSDLKEIFAETETREIESTEIKLIQQIIKAAILNTINSNTPDPEIITDEIIAEKTDHILDDYIEISISKDNTVAYIKKKELPGEDIPELTVSNIHEILLQKKIFSGLMTDDIIETWISNPSTEKIIIAKGKKPVQGIDGTIKFHFKTDYSNPGKISKDGSIDFRQRGDIPFVSEEILLAEKSLPVEGEPGISVSGGQILVDDIFDPPFEEGPGTRMSDDKLKIYSTIKGQPHVDALGVISINSDLEIAGDVDFETGNIDFNGNIIIKGMIKEGFTVKGINLTVNEIEGGIVNITGDLNVSSGITDATITTHGNIQAKFISNSNIMSFGNLTVQKEILDSKILLSGNCNNITGHIIASQIAAKLGIEAGSIGTSSSVPVKLKIGVEDHINTLKDQIHQTIETLDEHLEKRKKQLLKHEDKDKKLHQLISEKVQEQEKVQIQTKKLNEMDKTANLQTKTDINNKLQKNAKTIEQELNTIFKNQDSIANDIQNCKHQMTQLEKQKKQLAVKEGVLTKFSKKENPIAVITIAKKISQGSIIKGRNASLILKTDTSRCKIQELLVQNEDTKFHEMTIVDI